MSCSMLTLNRNSGRLRKLDIRRLRSFKTSPKQCHFQPRSRYFSGLSRWSAVNNFNHRERFYNIFATKFDLDFHRLNFTFHLPTSWSMSSIRRRVQSNIQCYGSIVFYQWNASSDSGCTKCQFHVPDRKFANGGADCQYSLTLRKFRSHSFVP